MLHQLTLPSFLGWADWHPSRSWTRTLRL